MSWVVVVWVCRVAWGYDSQFIFDIIIHRWIDGNQCAIGMRILVTYDGPEQVIHIDGALTGNYRRCTTKTTIGVSMSLGHSSSCFPLPRLLG